MNAASSRSHSVFVLNVVQRQTDGSETVSHTTHFPSEISRSKVGAVEGAKEIDGL